MKWCVNLKMYKDLVLSEVKLKNMSEAYSSLCDLFKGLKTAQAFTYQIFF